VACRVLAILRRRSFDFLTIVSLLLCLATVALWVRSYWRLDLFAYVRAVDSESTRNFGIRNLPGAVEVFDFPFLKWHAPGWRFVTTDSHPETTAWHVAGDAPGSRRFSFIGFGYVHAAAPPPYDFRELWFPHWFLVLLFAILPAIRLRSILRTRRRHRSGLCPHCGYDLRATPDRCPECGYVPRALVSS
jgi:hypothetical protein